jgi:hypothetical protein
MAYKSYGSSRGFRPIQIGQGALNEQRRKDEQTIRSLRTVADQTEARDNEIIQNLKDKFQKEQANRRDNQQLEDQVYRQRTESIERNARRTRQNFETEQKNIEREAETWKVFSETASETLLAFAEHRKKVEEIDALKRINANPSATKMQTAMSDAYWEKVAYGTAVDADQIADAGGGSDIVANTQQISPEWKTISEKKAVIKKNLGNYQFYVADAINKSGAFTYEEIKNVVEKAAVQYAVELGVGKDTHLLGELIEEQNKVNGKLITEAWTTDIYTKGKKSVAASERDFELYGLGTDRAQHWLDILSYNVKNSFDEEGDSVGLAGVKQKYIEILSNPKLIKNDAQREEFLNLKTLSNTRNGVITRQSMEIGKLLTPSELQVANEAWEKKKDDDRKRDETREKARQNDLYQSGKKALLDEWDGSPKQKRYIFNQLRQNHVSEDTLKKLERFTLHSDRNTDLQDARDKADDKIEIGQFFESDFNELPPVLRLDPKYKTAFQSMQKLAEEGGWDEGEVKKQVKGLVVVDTLKLQGVSIDPVYNSTVEAALVDAKNDFYRYFKDHHVNQKKSAVQARIDAWEQVSKEVASGQGKWRLDSEYKGADRTIGTNHFPYFHSTSSEHMVAYPPAHAKQLIKEQGPGFLKTTQVISNADLKEQIANVNKGAAWEISQEVQDYSDESGLGVSEILNNNLELAGLKDQVKIKPSIKETTMEKVKKAKGNSNLVNFTKNLRSLDDAAKARIATVEPRLQTAMSGTTRFNGATHNMGTGESLYIIPEQLMRTPKGAQILQQYMSTGRPRNGARVVSRRPVKGGGFKTIVKLPEQEPQYLFLFDGGN